MSTFSERLRQLRKEKNMSQAYLASELKAGLSTVASWEVDKRYPSRENMQQLADIFNVDIDYLFGRSDVRQKISFDKDGNQMIHLSLLEKEIISKYRAADDVSKEMVHRSLGIDLSVKEKNA